MYKIGQYKEYDKLSDLICANYPTLLVISRFGISLGFGDKSIREVCEENNVDTQTFLAVVNLLINEEKTEVGEDVNLSLSSLIKYLKNSHIYFLEYRLPKIRKKLLKALGEDDISKVIIRFYDEYVNGVHKHIFYEDTTVFSYAEMLIEGRTVNEYTIDVFSYQHGEVDAKLAELRDIIIKYYPSQSSNELNSAMFDIFTCADDLASHNAVEDYIFTPLVRRLELQIKPVK